MIEFFIGISATFAGLALIHWLYIVCRPERENTLEFRRIQLAKFHKLVKEYDFDPETVRELYLEYRSTKSLVALNKSLERGLKRLKKKKNGQF